MNPDFLVSPNTHRCQVLLEGIDIASSSKTLTDIESIIEDLNWIPSPPPKELGQIFPQLLDISQDVKAANGGTKSRRSELLKRPINNLQSLQQSIALEKNSKIATSYRRITDNWLQIIKTAQQTLEEQSQYPKEILQAYIAGNSLEPETAKYRFKGRIDIFRMIESLTLSEQPPTLLLHGDRRTGKTSALKYLPHKVDSSIIPLLIDLQGTASATTLNGLAENLANQMIEAARRLPRSLDLPYPNLGNDRKFRSTDDPFIELQKWFTKIEEKNPGKRFLLCLDEFERLSEVIEAIKSKAPLNFLRNILQHRRKWVLLFSGAHLINELEPYWSDYLINTSTVTVSFLDEESARELILQPVETFPNIYQPEAVDKIIEITHCQPYLIQLLCYQVVEFINQEIRANKRENTTAKVSLEDIETVIHWTIEAGGGYFNDFWKKSLNEKDRDFIHRLLRGENPREEDRGVVRRLTRKDILTPEGNALQVPLIQRYIEEFLDC